MSRRRKPAASTDNDASLQTDITVSRAALQLPAGVLPMFVPFHTALVPETPTDNGEVVPPPHLHSHNHDFSRRLRAFYSRHLLIIFALLFLIAGAVTIKISGDRWLNNTVKAQQAAVQSAPAGPAISGLNAKLPAAEFDSKLQAITSQPAVITVGEKPVTIPADTIKGWLAITPSKDRSEYYMRVKTDAIAAGLLGIANQHVKAPVDQVTATHDGVTEVIVAGRAGTSLINPDDLKIQAANAAKTLMDSKGLQFYAPTQTQAPASLTPANFDKLIEVDIVTKQMYLYDKGSLTYSYPISAGAPATPTPVGRFKIYAKLAEQDMRGLNTDGSPYFQPKVRWVNYFLSGGYAVHGNYWRPTSWFGAINSSHGCVSLPDYQAKVVYDWAPLGTTVITHY